MANEIKQLSYRDVLHTRERIGHINLMLTLAKQLGYPYFIWNDRVYHISSGLYHNTDLTIANVI